MLTETCSLPPDVVETAISKIEAARDAYVASIAQGATPAPGMADDFARDLSALMALHPLAAACQGRREWDSRGAPPVDSGDKPVTGHAESGMGGQKEDVR